MVRKILWFTDAHVLPGEDLSRFTRLGQFIVQRSRPDIIIQGGDFGTMEALSHWDKDKRLKMENRRFFKDMEAVNEAISLLSAPIIDHNDWMKKQKQKQYLPEIYWFQGNHEHWVDGYVEKHPELEGTIDFFGNLKWQQIPHSAFHYIPFKTETWWVEIDGVYFCHIPRNKTGPVSSKYIADRALEVFNGSVVFGHTHRLVASSCRRIGSDLTHQSLCGGCFFESDPEYAIGNANDYWKGVIELSIHSQGVFDYKTISIEAL